MSQVFSGDSVNISGTGTVTTNVESTVVTGNFLNPPFQNAKAIVIGTATLGVGTGTTNVIVRIRRNPAAENVVVAGSNNLSVTAGTNVGFSFQAADAIPDGRPVQYALTLTQLGGTGNGNIFAGNITALLISG